MAKSSWTSSAGGLIVPLLFLFTTMGVIVAYTYLVYLPSPWNLTVVVSGGKMHPAEIVVSKGARVILNFAARGADHELSVPYMNIHVKVPNGGQSTIEFSADRLGVFPVRAFAPESGVAGTINVVEQGFGAVEHEHG